MFLTHKILDLVVKTKDDAHALVLSAFDSSYRLSLGAKEIEIEALTRLIADLGAQLKYERARADNLADRLLVRDAHVAAVSPAALETAKHKDEVAVKKLREVFDQLNDIAVEVPAKTHRAFDLAGGSAVVEN